MRVIVVGAGEVGYHVAERLARDRYDIVVVDTEPQRLEYVDSHLDVAVIEGNGASPTVLERAGIARAGLLLAVTSVDEVNLVACAAASGPSGIVKIARVSNPDFYRGIGHVQPGRFGVDVMINPERELAADTLRLLQSTAATDIAVFADREIQVISIPVVEGAPIADKTLAEISTKIGEVQMLTAAIERNGSTLVPRGSTKVCAGDQVYVVTKPATIPLALELAGHEHSRLTNVMIAGGSTEAYYLTEMLQQLEIQATVLVDDRTRAQEFAEKRPKALILNGDATDVELLEMEGVGAADAFVALTDEDQTNILSSLVAKHAGAKQVVTLVNKIEYMPLARRVGIDAAVSPRLSAANAIMGHMKKGSVTRVSTFKDTDAEAISFRVSVDCPVVGQALADVEFPEGSVVAAIERDGEVTVPRGDSKLVPGDTAVVFALPDAIDEVTKLFPS